MIIPELSILRLFISNPEIYQQYQSCLDRSYLKDSYPEVYNIFLSLIAWRSIAPENTSIEDLHTYHLSRKQLSAKERNAFEDVFRQIVYSEASEQVILDLLKVVNKRNVLQQLAVASFESIDNESRRVDVTKLYESLGKEINAPTEKDTFVTDDLEELYDQTVKTIGLRWTLKSLNKSLGSLRKGDFGFVFARPETGKTTFISSQISGMAGQTDKPIILFNNEEQGSKVMLRIYQAALSASLEQLLSNPIDNKKKFYELTKGNIRIYDNAIISKNDVIRICDSLHPALIVFDQIDKIKGFNADRKDLELGDIYVWARELAKMYAPVIGICQADGSGEGQKWLTMANVSNAKTSKQAEADWILGIGKQNEAGMEYVRHFYVSKNKLFGDEDSDPEMRHGKWDVKIKPDIAQYEDYLKNN